MRSSSDLGATKTASTKTKSNSITPIDQSNKFKGAPVGTGTDLLGSIVIHR